MKIRKKNNNMARIAKLSRALLRLETIGVISLHTGHQLICDIKHGCLVQPSPHVANALLDLPHKWTIYIAVFMRLESGKITYKPVELYIDNQYKFNDLEEVIRSEYSKLINSCNSLRIIGSGFIANPNQISLEDKAASTLFEKACARAAIEDEKTKKVIDIEERNN